MGAPVRCGITESKDCTNTNHSPHTLNPVSPKPPESHCEVDTVTQHLGAEQTLRRHLLGERQIQAHGLPLTFPRSHSRHRQSIPALFPSKPTGSLKALSLSL